MTIFVRDNYLICLGLVLIGLPSVSDGQVCAISVTAQGVLMGSGQSAATRTTNTLKLNSMFANVAAGQIACHNIEFPEGVIEINGPIAISLGPITIGGVNRERSIIRQTVSTAPVFKWNSNSSYTTGIYVHDLQFDNSNTLAPYNAAQWGLQFQCSSNGTGGNGWGYANNQFERLTISHMNVGVGEYTASGGVCPMWGSHFVDILFYNTQRNAIFLVSSGQSGQPANMFDRVDILQDNNPPPTTGDAIYIVAGNGLHMNSINIEGWRDEEIQIYGGSATVINNLRVEHAVFSSSAACNPAIAFFQGDVTLNGTSISWDAFGNTCLANVFSLSGSDTSVHVNGLSLGSAAGAPSTPVTMWRVNTPTPPARIFANGMFLNGIASEYVPSTNSSLTTTLYSRYAIDYLPPPVDKLPAASSYYVGRSFRVVSGVSDIAYHCVRNSAGVYSWVQ